MDDLNEKLGSILSDPKAMREIAALASRLGVDTPGIHSGGPDNGSAGNVAHDRRDDADNVNSGSGVNAGSGINGLLSGLGGTSALPMMAGLLPMLSSVKADDDTTRLLDAIRPFLSPERQKKLDRAKKLIQVMRLLPLIKEMDLF